MLWKKPETIARYALNIETENLSKDYYETYLERINAITVEDVQNAAKKYFAVDKARIVVTGKGSDVLDNLEKVVFNGKKVPVKYFDKNVEKTEKPNYQMSLPEGTTLQTVLDNYVTAVGGKEKLESVTSYSLVAEAEMQGMKLILEIKRTSENQFMQDIKVMGNSMSKQVLDGNKGYMIMQGQRKDMSEEELKKVQEESIPFPELGYTSNVVSLEGIALIDGTKTYEIKISDEKKLFL